MVSSMPAHGCKGAGTRVIAASSAFAYQGSVDDAGRIARELGANVITTIRGLGYSLDDPDEPGRGE